MVVDRHQPRLTPPRVTRARVCVLRCMLSRVLLRVLGCSVLVASGGLAQGARAGARPDTVVRLATAPRFTTVSVVNDLTIGGADASSEYDFSGIPRVLPARDGTIWVSDGGAFTGLPRVRRFDSLGKFIHFVGRRGQGPGEYQGPRGFGQLNDGRVVLRDASIANRLTVYRADGKFDRAWTFDIAIPPGPMYYAPVVDNRDVLWLETAPSPFLPGVPRGFVRIGRDGRIVDTVVTPSLPAVAVTPGTRDVVASPYRVRRGARVSPGGYLATYSTDQYAINLVFSRSARGSPPRDSVVSVRRNVDPVRLSDREVREVTAYLRSSPLVAPGAHVQEVERTKPPLIGVEFGVDGRIWATVSAPSVRVDDSPLATEARRFNPWREVPVFDVFEPDGAYLGRVTLSLGAVPLAMRGDTIWCLESLADDIRVLRRYRVVWGL